MSRRILLADDSVTIQKVIELTFMDDDYEVRAVGNGDEALAMLSALDVDIVIADVHMPGASGYEVCRGSKRLRPAVPVLLLVGTFEPFDEAQAKEAGADSFLKKPFDSQELLARVHTLLGAAPTANAAAAAPTAPAADEHAAHAAAEAPEAGAAAAEHPVEAASSWQEFELEAEPELIPGPWDHPAPAAAPVAPPTHFEQPFALGDLEEPEAQETFAVPGAPAAAGFEPPLQAAPAPQQNVPFTLGESLDDHAFLFDEAATPRAAEHGAAASPAGTAVNEAAAPPSAAAEPSAAAAFAESAALKSEEPAAPSPFIAHSTESEGAAAAPAAHPAVAAAAEPGAVVAEGNGRAVGGGGLSEADVDRIARRVVELVGEKVVRDVAWEVIPDLAEVVIKDRLRELESQVE
jgi:CheY-like chemotaxis protein